MKCSARVYTFLFISKIHHNTEIRDRNLSPSKVVTFLYIGTVTAPYVSMYNVYINSFKISFTLQDTNLRINPKILFIKPSINHLSKLCQNPCNKKCQVFSESNLMENGPSRTLTHTLSEKLYS